MQSRLNSQSLQLTWSSALKVCAVSSVIALLLALMQGRYDYFPSEWMLSIFKWSSISVSLVFALSASVFVSSRCERCRRSK